MPEYDNPAGRLHGLLSRYSERRNKPILNAWAHALDVEPDEVIRNLGIAADLVEETRRAAIGTNEASFGDMPAHLDTLVPIVSPTKHAMAGTGANNALPDAITMAKLAMLSAHLSQHSPEALPDDDDVERLIKAVKDLIEEVRDSDIDLDVMQAVLRNLEDVFIALQHVRTQGPEAVKRAALALGGSAVFYEKQSGNSVLLHRIMTVAAVISLAFSNGAAIQSNIAAWNELFHGEVTLSTPLQPLQLLPGDSQPPGN